MDRLLKVLAIVIALTLLIATILFMALNMPFIYGNGSFGMMIITIIIFAVIAVVSIVTVIKDEHEGRFLLLILLCLALMVIPIRGFIASKEMRNPFENIKVEMVNYEATTNDGVYIDIQYTNNTKVCLEISGKLSLYQGDKLVAQFDIEARLPETNEGNITSYHIPAESLYGVDYKNLTVKYTYESIEVDIHTYHYEPKEVTLS